MSAPTVRGNISPQLQNEWWQFDPSTGWRHGFDYHGAGQGLMQLLLQSYVAAGMSARVVYHRGDTATLEIDDPTYSYTIDKWEIVGNEESRDLLGHPDMVNTLSDSDLIKFRAHLDKDPPDSPTSVFTGSGDLASYAGGIVQKVYGLIIRNQTEYRNAQYVLRHTTNAPARWAVNIADWGVDNVYTPAQLLSECSNSSLWTYPLPNSLYYQIAYLSSPSVPSGYRWGWLKSAPIKTTAANNRIDIVTEYTLEVWPTFIYPAY